MSLRLESQKFEAGGNFSSRHEVKSRRWEHSTEGEACQQWYSETTRSPIRKCPATQEKEEKAVRPALKLWDPVGNEGDFRPQQQNILLLLIPSPSHTQTSLSPYLRKLHTPLLRFSQSLTSNAALHPYRYGWVGMALCKSVFRKFIMFSDSVVKNSAHTEKNWTRNLKICILILNLLLSLWNLRASSAPKSTWS